MLPVFSKPFLKIVNAFFPHLFRVKDNDDRAFLSIRSILTWYLVLQTILTFYFKQRKYMCVCPPFGYFQEKKKTIFKRKKYRTNLSP